MTAPDPALLEEFAGRFIEPAGEGVTIRDPDVEFDEEPDLDDEMRARAQALIDAIDPDGPDEPGMVTAAAGADVVPNRDQLKHYWTRGKGLARWAASPRPWTTLVKLLTKHVGKERAKRFASRWFIQVFGHPAGGQRRGHAGPG
jgi:hypothetical protein